MGKRGRQRIRAGAIAAMVVVVGAFLPASAAARGGDSTAFCKGPAVAGFLKQLERMPRLHEPEDFERLGPWAPGSVYLSGAGQIQAGPASVGWGLRYGILARRLDWLVTSTMTPVNLKGKAVGETQTKQVEVGRPGRNAFTDLTFSVPATAAIYKVEISFRNAGGKLLDRFARFFRIVEARTAVRLKLNAASVRPGGKISARVENLGTSFVTYGVPFSIQVFDGTAWTRAPQSPRGPWIMPLLASAPGRSGSCNSIRLPADTPAGRYRFVKPLETPRKAITAEFDVVS